MTRFIHTGLEKVSSIGILTCENFSMTFLIDIFTTKNP